MDAADLKLIAQRSKIYQRIFNLPHGEELIADFSCALFKRVLIQGRIFISHQHICFFSNLFGFKTQEIVPVKTITAIKKRKTAVFVNNAIEVYLDSGESLFFSSFLHRDDAYTLMKRILFPTASASDDEDEPSRSDSSSRSSAEFLAYEESVNDAAAPAGSEARTEVPLGPVKRSSRDVASAASSSSSSRRSPPSPSYSSSASVSRGSDGAPRAASPSHGSPSPFTMDSLCEAKKFDSKRDLLVAAASADAAASSPSVVSVSPSTSSVKKAVTWSTVSSLHESGASTPQLKHHGTSPGSSTLKKQPRHSGANSLPSLKAAPKTEPRPSRRERRRHREDGRRSSERPRSTTPPHISSSRMSSLPTLGSSSSSSKDVGAGEGEDEGEEDDISSDYAYVVVRGGRSSSEQPKKGEARAKVKANSHRHSRAVPNSSSSSPSSKTPRGSSRSSQKKRDPNDKRLSLRLPTKENSIRDARRLSQPTLASPRASIDGRPKASPSSNPSSKSSSTSPGLASMSNRLVRSKTPQGRTPSSSSSKQKDSPRKSSRRHKSDKSKSAVATELSSLNGHSDTEASSASPSSPPPDGAASSPAKPKEVSPSSASPLLHDPMAKTSRVSASKIKAAQFKDVTLDEIASVSFPIPAFKFYEHFFADNAVYPVTEFLRRTDATNMEMDKWTKGSDGVCERKLKYNAPVVDPPPFFSGTMTLFEEHKCRMLGNGSALVVEKLKRCEGVKYSDCFEMCEVWEVTNDEDHHSCQLSVRYGLRFVKSTFFKSLIKSRSKSETQAAAEKWGTQALESLSAYRADADGERVSGEQNVAYERLRSSIGGEHEFGDVESRSASTPSPLDLPDEFPDSDPLLGSTGLLSPLGDPNSLFAESPRPKKVRRPPAPPAFVVAYLSFLVALWEFGARWWVRVFPDADGIERRKQLGVRVSFVVFLVVTFLVSLWFVSARVSTLQHQLDTLQARLNSLDRGFDMPTKATSSGESEALLERLAALESSMTELQMRSSDEPPTQSVDIDMRTPSLQVPEGTPAPETCADDSGSDAPVSDDVQALRALISQSDDLNSLREQILSNLEALSR